MAEKRKLPPRRESSVKRRVSEAPQPQPAKRNASTPGSRPPPPQERVRRPLPTKIKEGEALPTVPMPQPASLSTKDYQSIAQRCDNFESMEFNRIADFVFYRLQCRPLIVPGTIKEEVAQRWHSAALLDETEENEEGANRGKESSEGIHDQGWSV
jgi:hypothetical protein